MLKDHLGSASVVTDNSDNGVGDIGRMSKNVIHELGHAFNNCLAYPDPNNPFKTRNPDNDMSSAFTRDLLKTNPSSSDDQRWEWQQSGENTSSEIFADMFIAWTYNVWNTDLRYTTEINNAQNWISGLAPKP